MLTDAPIEITYTNEFIEYLRGHEIHTEDGANGVRKDDSQGI